MSQRAILKHLKNIYKSSELNRNSDCAKFAQSADNGKACNYNSYSLLKKRNEQAVS